jgi:hypothetical protein
MGGRLVNHDAAHDEWTCDSHGRTVSVTVPTQEGSEALERLAEQQSDAFEAFQIRSANCVRVTAIGKGPDADFQSVTLSREEARDLAHWLLARL